MEAEDETNEYLGYLNDSEVSENFLLTHEDGLTDNFSVEPIFTEIGPSDWPTVLLNNTLITEDCDKKITNENAANSDKELAHEKSEADNQQTYINYAPIVKEKEDGNREIYLTEKDINNDAQVIQLLNTDGSIITIDKSILHSINLPVQQKENTFTDFFTTVSANKCKLCNFLCEKVEEMKEHLNVKHPGHFVIKNEGPPSLNPKNNMISVLDKSKLNGNIKNEYTIFVCSICKDVCSDKETLKQHMVKKHNCREVPQTHSDDNELESRQKSLSSIKALSRFLIKKQQKALKKVRCSIPGCKLRFPNESIKEKHEKYHAGDTKKHFKCLECEQKFSLWRVCKSHLWKMHKIDMGLFVCPMCNSFKSISSANVLTHMAIHNEEKPFVCAVCDKTFKTMSQMQNHATIHKEPSAVPNWATLKKCEICHRFFANSKTLKKHIQSVHEQFKPFICNICGHKTSRKAMLELHLRQHTGAKPHKCPYCDYRTGDHNCLRKHVMKHMGAHQYQCQHCTYTCIQSTSLKSHMLHKHPGKSGAYACRYCPYTSINQDAFLAHEKCHENSIRDANEAKINTEKPSNASNGDHEDDETQHCFLNVDHSNEETVDTGGITIPAGFEMQLVS